jgi:beta-N-acetylhexosaminidase
VAALLPCLALTAGCFGQEDPAPRDAATPQESTVAPTPPAPPTVSQRLGLADGWGPTRGELDRAARDVRKLRLPDLAGQVIVAEWHGTAAPVDLVRDLHLGGVIAFESNVASARQISRVNRALQRQVPRRWPLFIGVDQEGGVVQRMRRVATRFPTFMSAWAAADPALTSRSYRAGADELRGLGFTVDFAPDADVTSGPADPTIGARSASSRPRLAATHTVAAAEGFVDGGVVPVVKHFPGHGSVPADSHLTLPVQRRTMAQLQAIDLVPFRAAVESGLPAVMVGHLDVRAVDPGVPATLSRPVVTDLLRNELGFEGLVVTDSMSMTGLTRGRDPGRSAVRAMRAGVDVLLMPPSPAVARTALVRAVRQGRLSRRRLEQAAARQIALLRHLSGQPGKPVGSARRAARALSAGAITQVSGECGVRLVGEGVRPVGDSAAVAAFNAAARAAGLEVLRPRATPRRLTAQRARPTKRRKESRRAFRGRLRAWRKAERRREANLRDWLADEEARLAAGTRIGFSGYHDGPVDAQIAVATDSPWVLGRSSAPVRIATYGDTPGAMAALVEVLLGRASAPGRLPVRVAGVEREGCAVAGGSEGRDE